MTVVGTRRLRREDRILLTGEARFVDDLPVTGVLHLKVVRSPFAHARILSINSEPARSMAGVSGDGLRMASAKARWSSTDRRMI